MTLRYVGVVAMAKAGTAPPANITIQKTLAAIVDHMNTTVDYVSAINPITDEWYSAERKIRCVVN